jgi:hypothetical protein
VCKIALRVTRNRHGLRAILRTRSAAQIDYSANRPCILPDRRLGRPITNRSVNKGEREKDIPPSIVGRRYHEITGVWHGCKAGKNGGRRLLRGAWPSRPHPWCDSAHIALIELLTACAKSPSGPYQVAPPRGAILHTLQRLRTHRPPLLVSGFSPRHRQRCQSALGLQWPLIRGGAT